MESETVVRDAWEKLIERIEYATTGLFGIEHVEKRKGQLSELVCGAILQSTNVPRFQDVPTNGVHFYNSVLALIYISR